MFAGTGADACAYRLKRCLTLDPTGLSGDLKHLEPCCPCEEQLCSPVSDPAAPPTPFVAAAAASRDVVTAFQEQRELPAPVNPFVNQDTLIASTSSDEGQNSACQCSLPPPRLSCTLSSPAEGSCANVDTAPLQNGLQRQSSACLGVQGSCPAHGVKAVCGKRNKMEDMYAVQPNFFDIPLPLSPTSDDLQNKLPQRIATQLEAADNSPTTSAPLSPSGGHVAPAEGDQSINSYGTASDTAPVSDTLHFFGVYDGHGGCQAAEHCAKRLHHHLSHSLATACGCLVTDGNQLLQAPEPDASQVEWDSSLVQSVANFACQNLLLSRSDSANLPSAFHGSAGEAASSGAAQVDGKARLLGKVSSDSDSSSGSSAPEEHTLCPLPENDPCFDNESSGSGASDRSDGISVTGILEEALKEAFVKTDAEFANDNCASMVGSTALVALVGTRKVWLANCGDSRAVLCRNSKAIQLTDDHKPEREDEAERVEKAGGQVLFWNGHRVMGVLAMSRAIGDHGLRPYIIPEPEISVVCRTDDDDFLLLASDGLWDVMSNQEATNLCIRCIKRAREKGASRNAAVRIAASVLTKAAIDRGSKDNVTVVIVDLRNERPGVPSGVQPAAAEGCSLPAASPCPQAVDPTAAPRDQQQACGGAASSGAAAEEVPELPAAAALRETADVQAAPAGGCCTAAEAGRMCGGCSGAMRPAVAVVAAQEGQGVGG